MDSLLIASNFVLWGAVLALGLLVYALSRQVASLFERIAPAGALMVNQVLKVGDAAPAVEVGDLNGNSLTVGGAPAEAAATRSTLIFFLAPDCPISRTLLPVLRSVAKSESWLDSVLASDGGTAAEHAAYATEHGLTAFPYVLSRALGETYGIGKIPYAVLIDEHGLIASLGLVNSREHLESLFEAKERNLASVQEYMQRYEPDAFANAHAQPGDTKR